MSGVQRLHLEDALEDSPQTRSLLGVFEKDAQVLKKYTIGFHQCCQRVLTAQHELSTATSALSTQLKAYEQQNFPLDSDDSILTSTLKQFSTYLDELSSIQQVLATQLADSMMYPVSKFVQADLEELTNMCEMMQISTNDHESALGRYMKLPRKKENERNREDAANDLFLTRRKFHQTSLHYYSALNSVQYKRKYSLIEPMIGFLHAQRAFFQMGQETLSKTDMDDFLSNMNASVQDVHRELGQDTQKTVEMMDSIERQSAHLYHAEPPSEMPYIPPNPTLSSKAGYLYLRSKQALIATKWERCYFFIQGGNLMCQSRSEVAGALVMDLGDDGVHAEPIEIDDRRNVFHIISPINKKTVIVQAENERERDEWLSTIRNAVKESGSLKDLTDTLQGSMLNSNQEDGFSVSSTSSAISIPRAHDPDRDSQMSRSGAPPTPPSTPADSGFFPDAPIQFDMISPSEEAKPFKPEQFKEGPPKRINPFDQNQSVMDIHSENNAGNAAFYQTFEVRFLGSMEVKNDRGEQLVLETIRQIMAARALHNVFRTTESHLVVSSDCMRLLDPSNNTVRTEFQLEDISFWCAHKENKRLFGFITRSKGSDGSRPTFACHVFECNTSADDICHAISTATKLAFQALMEKKALQKQRSKEQEILLANIDQLVDHDQPVMPQLSPDGRFMLLQDNSPTDAMPSDSPPAPVPCSGEEDRPQVEEDDESEA